MLPATSMAPMPQKIRRGSLSSLLPLEENGGAPTAAAPRVETGDVTEDETAAVAVAPTPTAAMAAAALDRLPRARC